MSDWNAERTQVLQMLADVYLEQGQTDKALTLLEALAVLAPQEPGVFRALGYACLRDGRYAAALAATDALLRLDPAMPANAPVLLIRARALWALGRGGEAQDCWRRYRELSPAAPAPPPS
jgi:tetratricopeptide (TPR) repeat protein